jgi:hypothetical protein
MSWLDASAIVAQLPMAFKARKPGTGTTVA